MVASSLQGMADRSRSALLHAVRAAIEGEARLVLAVSGGVDSMSLLDAASRVRPPGLELVVATVDHGTGPAATEAAALVCAESARRGLRVRSERLAMPSSNEAAWRAARWEWLRRVALEEHATIATAHTRDDHVETVVMRILRGSGARGLAALLARGPILRPLIEVERRDVAAYARASGLVFLEDPTNGDRRFFRNRVRLDLLPAIRAARPEFEAQILELSRRAAEVRRELEEIARPFLRSGASPHRADFDAAGLATLPEASLCELWPALAGLAGVALDRRGTVRLARFTAVARSGDRVQVSGGVEVVRSRDAFSLLRSLPAEPGQSQPLVSTGRFGRFRFRRLPSTSIKEVAGNAWFASLPRGADVRVRAWVPGDRMLQRPGSLRRVKRFLADAGIPGPLRIGWPVVLVDGDIVWIPGVRRSPFATHVNRRSSTVYHCELYSI